MCDIQIQYYGETHGFLKKNRIRLINIYFVHYRLSDDFINS